MWLAVLFCDWQAGAAWDAPAWIYVAAFGLDIGRGLLIQKGRKS